MRKLCWSPASFLAHLETPISPFVATYLRNPSPSRMLRLHIIVLKYFSGEDLPFCCTKHLQLLMQFCNYYVHLFWRVQLKVFSSGTFSSIAGQTTKSLPQVKLVTRSAGSWFKFFSILTFLLYIFKTFWPGTPALLGIYVCKHIGTWICLCSLAYLAILQQSLRFITILISVLALRFSFFPCQPISAQTMEL